MMKISVKAIPMLVRERRILLIREAEYEGGAYPGFWDVPGGTVEAGETWLDTLVRECAEEIGLDIRTNIQGRIMQSFIFQYEDTLRIYVPMPLYHTPAIMLSKHHDAAEWFTRNGMPNDMMPRLNEICNMLMESWE